MANRIRHTKTRRTLIGFGVMVVALLLVATFINWNLLRGPISRVIEAKTGRPTSIEGNLRVHLWSWNPRAEVEGLRIENPQWAKRRVMFDADRISMTVSLGRLLRGQVVLPRLEVFGPNVNLERDAKGRASWEFTDEAGNPPEKTGEPAQIPTIRRLLIHDGKIDVVDRLKKLTLNGTLTAGEDSGKRKGNALQLRLKGHLNAKPLRVEFNGGPLVSLDPNTPYDFDASINASTIRLTAVVSIVKPFDLSEFTAKLHFTGDDLADAYYLTSVALPNTAPYDISGNVRRTNALFEIENLRGKIGSSDINGSLSVNSRKKRLALKGNLTSKNLDLKDLAPTLGTEVGPTGKPQLSPASAARVPAADAPAEDAATSDAPDAARATQVFLFPDADLEANRVREMDADVFYKAQSVTATRLPMKQVNFHLVLKDGVLALEPLSFVLAQGTVAGTVRIDARPDTPATAIDMRVEKVDLSQFKGAKASDAPLSGELQGRLQVQGTGASVHKLAATANGNLAIAIPRGEIRDVLAELTGINVLKGLGLLFANDAQKVEIRCGVMNFNADNGTLKANTFFIDTTNVLITGGGEVHLGSEALDLAIRGSPKHLRLVRLRAPVSLGGTLADPAIGIKPQKLLVQTGAAVALSSLVAPVAVAHALIDPGLAKDKNCAAVLAQQNEITASNERSEQ